jgi:ribonuclease Z
MRGARAWGLTALVILVVLATGVWLARGAIAERIMARAFDRAMAGDPIAELPDGLHVGLCGSGAPMPDPTRAGPCTVVVAGTQLFVIDVGVGSVKNLALMRLPPPRVDAVFLTHFHSDHIGDLGEVMLQRWGGGARTSPLPIYGPTGVDQVVAGFEQAYQLDRGYREVHHGPKIMPPSGFGGAPHAFTVSASGPNVIVIDEPDLKVIAFPVNHHPVEPAVGYLFIYKGRRVVISGDTTVSPRLTAAAEGADVLVHEGLSPDLLAIQRQAALARHRTNLAAIMHDILSYHTTPEQAAREAEQAHVRYLLFTHIIPPLPMTALEGPWLGHARSLFHGTLRVGHDGDFLTLPAGTEEIRRTNRLRMLF